MKLILGFFCFIVLFIGNINSNVKAEISNNETLKIGLIVPLSGQYEEIGKSVLNSLRIDLKIKKLKFIQKIIKEMLKILSLQQKNFNH